MFEYQPDSLLSPIVFKPICCNNKLYISKVFLTSGTTGLPSGFRLSEQTLLSVGRLVPRCQFDASAAALRLIVCLATALPDAHLSITVCLPVLWPGGCWAKPKPSALRLALVPSDCYCSVNHGNPGALAHFCIVSEA